MVITDI